MPTIEVFLMFEPSDRNTMTTKKVTTTESGPNWTWIANHVAKSGYTLKVHGPSVHPSLKDIQDSMSTAEVTLLVGHGAATPGGAAGPKWVTDQITLTDGMIRSPDGAYVGKWNGSTLDGAKNTGKLTINKVTGMFTCNSTDEMPKAFDLPEGSHLVTNDGGGDGFTRIGTLELGAAEFVKEYVRKKGDVSKAMAKAQHLFIRKGRRYAGDKGDTLSEKVGAPPPPPASP